jgi:hypothetical protein
MCCRQAGGRAGGWVGAHTPRLRCDGGVCAHSASDTRRQRWAASPAAASQHIKLAADATAADPAAHRQLVQHGAQHALIWQEAGWIPGRSQPQQDGGGAACALVHAQQVGAAREELLQVQHLLAHRPMDRLEGRGAWARLRLNESPHLPLPPPHDGLHLPSNLCECCQRLRGQHGSSVQQNASVRTLGHACMATRLAVVIVGLQRAQFVASELGETVVGHDHIATCARCTRCPLSPHQDGSSGHTVGHVRPQGCGGLPAAVSVLCALGEPGRLAGGGLGRHCSRFWAWSLGSRGV